MSTAERARQLTERLVSLPSVSPDVAAESALAHALLAETGPGLEAGVWPTPDGRPVVHVRLPGRSAKTALLLAHYDTVGVDEYAALDDPAGAAIAFDPEGLRRRWLAAETDG